MGTLKQLVLLAVSIIAVSSCNTPSRTDDLYKARAEQFLRCVYGGDVSRIDSLVSDEIVSSYPIFEELFGTKTIRGREALKQFAIGFGERWTDAEVSVHDAIAEDEKVVLIWSFRAKRKVNERDSTVVPGLVSEWGGITLVRFDDSGRIIQELGEESTPGPVGRLK